MQNAEHRAIEEHQTNEHTVKHTPSGSIPKSSFQSTPNIANNHEACTTDVQQRSDNAIGICLHKQIHFF